MQRPIVAESLQIKPVRLLLGLIACVGLAVMFFTLLFGFTSVPANSVGVKTRFGAYHDIVNPGLAYAIPYIDEIYIVPTQRLLKLEFGFTSPNATNIFQGDVEPAETETMIIRRPRAGENVARSFRKRDARGDRRPHRGRSPYDRAARY